MRTKLGFQCSAGLQADRFDNISLYSYMTESNLAYSSAGFVYNEKEQNKLLHNAQPCIYTDVRYPVDQFYPQYIYTKVLEEIVIEH